MFIVRTGRLRPEAQAHEDQAVLAMRGESLHTARKHAESKLALVRAQLNELEIRLPELAARHPSEPSPTLPDWCKVTQAKVDRLSAEIERHLREGNNTMAQQLMTSQHCLQREIDDAAVKLKHTPLGSAQRKLARLRAEEDALEEQLFRLGERLDDFERECAERDAALDDRDERAEFERAEAADKEARFEAWRRERRAPRAA